MRTANDASSVSFVVIQNNEDIRRRKISRIYFEQKIICVKQKKKKQNAIL